MLVQENDNVDKDKECNNNDLVDDDNLNEKMSENETCQNHSSVHNNLNEKTNSNLSNDNYKNSQNCIKINTNININILTQSD